MIIAHGNAIGGDEETGALKIVAAIGGEDGENGGIVARKNIRAAHLYIIIRCSNASAHAALGFGCLRCNGSVAFGASAPLAMAMRARAYQCTQRDYQENMFHKLLESARFGNYMNHKTLISFIICIIWVFSEFTILTAA